jgi:hypothetical protein
MATYRIRGKGPEFADAVLGTPMDNMYYAVEISEKPHRFFFFVLV